MPHLQKEAAERVAALFFGQDSLWQLYVTYVIFHI